MSASQPLKDQFNIQISSKFLSLFKAMQSVCEQENINNSSTPIIYEVLQLSELIKKEPVFFPESTQTSIPTPTPDSYLETIADFYNYNYLGNPEFMHTPNFEQVIANYMQYPIVIAREKSSDTILAASTLKYSENSEEKIDPYFPFPNTTVLTMTGLLVSKKSPYKGLGQSLYRLEIEAARKFAELSADSPTRLMCEIDCRNFPSLRALSSAVNRINNSGCLGESEVLPANLLGFYTLSTSENPEKPVEAPTAVIEVGLVPQPKTLLEPQTLEFSHPTESSLYVSLLNQIKTQFGEKFELSSPQITKDGDSVICFYPFNKQCPIVSMCIEPNGTDKGTSRTPITDSTKFMQGPLPFDMLAIKDALNGVSTESIHEEEENDAR